MSLSAAEIGDPTAYPWVRKPPHTQATCPAPIANPRDQSPIASHATGEFSYGYVRRWLYRPNTVNGDMESVTVTQAVTVRKGQGCLFFSSDEALSGIPEGLRRNRNARGGQRG
jgi:hypothetical protein